MKMFKKTEEMHHLRDHAVRELSQAELRLVSGGLEGTKTSTVPKTNCDPERGDGPKDCGEPLKKE